MVSDVSKPNRQSKIEHHDHRNDENNGIAQNLNTPSQILFDTAVT